MEIYEECHSSPSGGELSQSWLQDVHHWACAIPIQSRQSESESAKLREDASERTALSQTKLGRAIRLYMYARPETSGALQALTTRTPSITMRLGRSKRTFYCGAAVWAACGFFSPVSQLSLLGNPRDCHYRARAGLGSITVGRRNDMCHWRLASDILYIGRNKDRSSLQ